MTTGRVTHASSAALFARSHDPASCECDVSHVDGASDGDIASQLVNGGGIDVVLGGGFDAFVPPEDAMPHREVCKLHNINWQKQNRAYILIRIWTLRNCGPATEPTA